MKILRTTALVVGFSLVASIHLISNAATVAAGFDTQTLSNNDDDSTGPVSLGFNFNYYGTIYSQAFVNNNGNVTFGGALADYTPTGLNGATKLPIIAPFFADVDTRESSPVTFGMGNYAGRNAFGVTYANVGYYDFHADKTNTFQLVLVDRSDVQSGDADIYFNYDSILFETGDEDGGVDGLGGIAARAGYSNGSGIAGTFFELTGSGVPGSFINGGPFALNMSLNNSTPGQYLFNVRAGVVTAPGVIPAPPTVGEVPEPGIVVLLGAGLLGLITARRRKFF